MAKWVAVTGRTLCDHAGIARMTLRDIARRLERETSAEDPVHRQSTQIIDATIVLLSGFMCLAKHDFEGARCHLDLAARSVRDVQIGLAQRKRAVAAAAHRPYAEACALQDIERAKGDEE